MKKISLILFFPFKGIAQDQFDPYELTLEQLGQIHIYTASRSLTYIDKAPAVVTVITREEIEWHGYQNLAVQAWAWLWYSASFTVMTEMCGLRAK